MATPFDSNVRSDFGVLWGEEVRLDFHQILKLMRPVVITFVHSGSEYPASVRGTKSVGGTGDVGSVVTTECTTSMIHAERGRGAMVNR